MPSATFARDLAGWFRKNARKLTWRQTRDPYAIWVSEVMLQQTRVETVERYFSPFIARFPSVQALASATQDEVLAMWSGLGYYRRARLLHQGARYVVQEAGGIVPGEVKDLLEIPGVGAYTAGAIASIAFNRPAALVDGNVARVSSRVRGVRDPKLQPATAKAHWTWAQGLVEQGRPRELAQAIMELGAVVCTPKNPACDGCPVSEECSAQAQGLAREIPAPKKKAPVKSQHLVALALVDRRDRLLFEQRGAEQLLAGLWSLPLLELSEAGALEAASWIEAYRERWPPALRQVARWGPVLLPQQDEVVHVFTHRRWTLKVATARFDGEWSRVLSRAPDFKGLGTQDGGLAHLRDHLRKELGGGVPTLTRKLLAALGQLGEKMASADVQIR